MTRVWRVAGGLGAAAIMSGGYMQGRSVKPQRGPLRPIERVERAGRAFLTAGLAGVDYKLTFWRLDKAPITFPLRAWKKYQKDGAGEKQRVSLAENDVAEITSRLHARNARRLLRLCQRNAGTFTKAGQAVANIAIGLPPEFGILRQLHDQALPMPFTDVQAVFREALEVGAPPEAADMGLEAPGSTDPRDIFDEFEETPIAAASLAQVHRARRRDTGELVAVKVQFLGLQERVQADTRTIEDVFAGLNRFFPDSFGARMGWVVDEFRRNMSQELDFCNEGRNCERAVASFLHTDGSFAVPRIHWDLTRRQVLTMEFIDDACRVNDLEGMKRLGIRPGQVAGMVSEIFAEQIFVNGFLHGDPHPGNLFVRRKPGSRSAVAGVEVLPTCDPRDVQLVVLDHGLYRTLTKELRIAYCELWNGAILRNQSQVNRVAEQLAGPKFADLFQLLLLPTNRYGGAAAGRSDPETRRRFREQFRSILAQEQVAGDGTAAPPPPTQNAGQSMPAADEASAVDEREKEERKQMERDIPRLFSELFEELPRDLIIVFKTQNLVRALVHELSAAGEVDRHLLMARAATLGLAPSRRRFEPPAAYTTSSRDGTDISPPAKTGLLTWFLDSLALAWFDLNVTFIKGMIWAFRKSPSP